MAPELLTVILASASCAALCLVILTLVLVLYRKDPLCCRFRAFTTQDCILGLEPSRHPENTHVYSSTTYFNNIIEEESQMGNIGLGLLNIHVVTNQEHPPPLCPSRHSFMGVAHSEHAPALYHRTMGPQPPGRLFIIGKPHDYHLGGALPPLPSYESVRKKDQQRQIHCMIAQRFGLSGHHHEPPPPYEETFCQSLEVQPWDPSLSSHSGNEDSSHPHENTPVVHQPSSAPRCPPSSS